MVRCPCRVLLQFAEKRVYLQNTSENDCGGRGTGMSIPAFKQRTNPIGKV